jgi:hypothetical protein
LSAYYSGSQPDEIVGYLQGSKDPMVWYKMLLGGRQQMIILGSAEPTAKEWEAAGVAQRGAVQAIRLSELAGNGFMIVYGGVVLRPWGKIVRFEKSIEDNYETNTLSNFRRNLPKATPTGPSDATRTEQLRKVRSELQKLEGQIAFEKGWHADLYAGSKPNPLQTAGFIASMINPLTAAAALVNPANRSVIGGAVNLLNPSTRPELSIWTKAEAHARVANQALQRGDIAQAATALAICNGHFLKASTRFRQWMDGIPLAGRRAELAIGVAAAAAIIVAVSVFAIEAAAVGTTGTVVAGETTTGVRVAAEVERGIRVVLTSTTLAEEQAGEEILFEEVPKLVMKAVRQ